MKKLDAIIEGVNIKDTKSWEQLYALYYVALCAYVERWVKDVEVAKDIVQELLVSIWHSDTVFSDGKEMLGYLYRSLYNRSIDFIRKKNMKARVLSSNDVEDRDDFLEDFLSRTVREEIMRRLYIHIGNLPPDRRRIMLLSIKGLSGKEIAEMLGISINTVKVQKNRSIKYLRECLIDKRKN